MLVRVIPFFLLIAVGAAAARARLIDLAGARALSAYVFWIAFPALLVHSLSHSPAPDGRVMATLGAYAVAMTLPLVVMLLLGRVLRWTREERAGTGMAAIGGNTAFLGAPLAVSLFGAAAAAPSAAVVATDCTIIMVIATATLRSAADASWKRTVFLTATNPLIIAAVVGLALSYAGLLPPAPIDQALATLRATASPVGLVALGVVVGVEFGKPAPGEARPVAFAVLAKMLLAPLLVWLAMRAVQADVVFARTAVLLAACPTAVNVFIQTRTLGVFAKGAAMVVVAGALAAVVSLPLLGALLSR